MARRIRLSYTPGFPFVKQLSKFHTQMSTGDNFRTFGTARRAGGGLKSSGAEEGNFDAEPQSAQRLRLNRNTGDELPSALAASPKAN